MTAARDAGHRIDWAEAPLRSFLFAPGSDQRKLERVATFNADVVVLDLEDAVARDLKGEARERVRLVLPRVARQATVLVRVNGPDTGCMAADLQAIGVRDIDGFVIPKVESPDVLIGVDRQLGSCEQASGLELGGVRVFALIETALGVARCEEIALAAPSRVVTLIFGLVNFASDMGIELSEDGAELFYARSRVAVAARAAGMRPAVDGPFLRLQDNDGLVRDSQRSRQLGFQGRVVVYPPQLEFVQSAYSELTPHDLERNRRIVAAFEEAESLGIASIQVDGQFVDYPAWQMARQKLHLFDVVQSSRVEGA